jgi:ATP-dependent DNA helicase RecQ
MRQTQASSNKRIQQVLENRFGFDSLRGAQKEVIDAVLRHENTLAILPTGAGKSLCFQLPALIIPGTTLVISPLIALMKDQQEKLEALEIEAIQLNSSLGAAEQRDAVSAMESTDFIYTTPERLTDLEFLKKLKSMKIDFVVIDEAHCITQWGHDFRPAYLSIRDAITQLGQPPILALTATATATEDVAEDIRKQLGLSTMTVIRAGVFRENLHYEAVLSESEIEKDQILENKLAELKGPGVIYASSIKSVEELYKRLGSRIGGVSRYHGQLSGSDRREAQDQFMSGSTELMIATNAFGMGIDKSDLRFVIHYNFPGSLEAYYQETGRAGRDGDPARCLNFFLAGKHPRPEHLIQVVRVLEKSGGPVSVRDLLAECLGVPKAKVRVILSTLREAKLVSISNRGVTLKTHGKSDSELETIAKTYEAKAVADKEKLKSMVVYAQTALCRWNVILKYFGEPALERGCQKCDNCDRERTRMGAVLSH